MFTNKNAEYLIDEERIRNPSLRTRICSFVDSNEFLNNSFFIYGGVGTGKTLLASFISWKGWNRFRIPFLFVGIPELYNRFSSIRYSQEGRELIESLKSVHLLVLDDLGSVDSSDFFQCILLEIADFRYVREMPTITTCDNIDRQNSRLLRRLTVDNTCLVKATNEGFTLL